MTHQNSGRAPTEIDLRDNVVNSSHQESPSKVLLLAYSCAPNRGSEPGVGWNWAIESAKNFDTWVITSEGEFADEIRQHLKERGEIANLHFAFVSRRSLPNHLKRNLIFYYLFYNRWHRKAFGFARRLHKQIGFDLVHQINW